MSRSSADRARKVLGRLLPPVALDAARVARRRVLREPPEWQFVGFRWPTPEDAARPRGWNEASVAHRYEAVWESYRNVVETTGPLAIVPEQAPDHDLERGPYDEHDVMFHNSAMTFAYAVARASGADGRIRLLDWGGATGHYYLLARALFPDLAIEYDCKEVPATASVGRRLAPEVRFIDDDRAFDREYDLVMASNSLQYAEDWPALLARLLDASRGFAFLHQVPVVHRAPSFAVMQRPYRYGYATEYASWCFRRTDLLREARAHGAALAREFVHGFKPPVVGAPEQPEYRGFLFDLRARPAAEPAIEPR